MYTRLFGGAVHLSPFHATWKTRIEASEFEPRPPIARAKRSFLLSFPPTSLVLLCAALLSCKVGDRGLRCVSATARLLRPHLAGDRRAHGRLADRKTFSTGETKIYARTEHDIRSRNNTENRPRHGVNGGGAGGGGGRGARVEAVFSLAPHHNGRDPDRTQGGFGTPKRTRCTPPLGGCVIGGSASTFPASLPGGDRKMREKAHRTRRLLRHRPAVSVIYPRYLPQMRHTYCTESEDATDDASCVVPCRKIFGHHTPLVTHPQNHRTHQ